MPRSDAAREGRTRFFWPLAGGACVLGVVFVLGALLSGCSPGSSEPVAPVTSAPVQSTASAPAPTAPSEPSPTSTSTTVARVVRVGVIVPQSGEFSQHGDEGLRGVQAAAEEIERAGGIAGLDGARLELVPADSQGDPDRAGAEMERLCRDEGVVGVIVPVQSAVALAVTEAGERLQVPVVVASAAADEITERDLAYTFRLCPKAEWYARDQAYFVRSLVTEGGAAIRQVALLYEDGPFGRETAADQKEYLGRAGITVVEEISYPATQADLHQEILAIESSDPDAVLTATYLSDALLVAEAVADARLRAPVIDAGGGFAQPDFVAGAGDNAEGLCTIKDPLDDWEPAALKQRFAATDMPLTAIALYSYQALLVLADALERSGAADPGSVRQALGRTNLRAGDRMVLPQTLLTFDGSGQNPGARLSVAQVQDGRYEIVWPVVHGTAAFRAP